MIEERINFVCYNDDYEFDITFVKDNEGWRVKDVKGDYPYWVPNQTYMHYLTKNDIADWLSKDFIVNQ